MNPIDLKKEKKTQIWYLLLAYTCFALLLFDQVQQHLFIKILIFLPFGFYLLLDHIMSLRLIQMMIKTNQQMQNESSNIEVSSARLKELVQAVDHNKIKDSILLTSQALRALIIENKSSASTKSFEVDCEFDAVLLVKRKSTPLEELLAMLDKAKEL